MLEAILMHLHNWFEVRGAAITGTFRIASGVLELEGVADTQYYRIEGSVFNDGLHQHPANDLKDETFTGRVCPLAIPKALIALSEEITAWNAENPPTDFVSESFGGYTYSRGNGVNASVGGWQSAFSKRLNAWRKI